MANPNREWARKIEDRLSRGDSVPMIAQRMAEGVLGRKIIRKMKGSRPASVYSNGGQR